MAKRKSGGGEPPHASKKKDRILGHATRGLTLSRARKAFKEDDLRPFKPGIKAGLKFGAMSAMLQTGKNRLQGLAMRASALKLLRGGKLMGGIAVPKVNPVGLRRKQAQKKNKS